MGSRRRRRRGRRRLRAPPPRWALGRRRRGPRRRRRLLHRRSSGAGGPGPGQLLPGGVGGPAVRRARRRPAGAAVAGGRGGGLAALEPLQPLEDRVAGPVGLGPAQPHERHLEDDARIGLLGQLHERLAEHLEGAGEPGGAELRARAPPPWRGRRRGGGDPVPSSPRGTRRADGRSGPRRGCGRRGRPRSPRRPPRGRRRRRGRTSASRMASTGWACSTTPPMADTWSRAERVSRAGAAALADHVVDGVLAEPELGVGDDVANVVGQLVGIEQVELEVLRAAPDGGEHLLRVGGAEDEHHVRRRFLERLEERVARARR